MNILHLNDKTAILGGVEVYLDQLQTLLPEAGINSAWMGIFRNTGNYQVQLFPEEKTCFSGSLQQLGEYLRSFADSRKTDLIHIHSISDPALVRLCLGIRPVVRSLHEPRMFCPGHGKFWRYSERICDQPFGLHCMWHAYTEGCTNRHPKRLISAYANTRFEIGEASSRYASIVVMSDYMKREAVLAGIPKEKVEVNPYFTPVVEADNLRPAPQVLRLLFLGRLIRHKGPHLMLKAVIPLLRQRPEIVLEIAGDGPEEPLLRQMAAEAGVETQVHFRGWQNRQAVEKLLTQATVVIFPSIYPEAFGISGIEAMMYAKPVVAFDVGGVSSWLDHEETGFIAPAGDWATMGTQIQQLVAQPTLRAAMASRARERALTRFTPEIHLRRLRATYEKALVVIPNPLMPNR
ncbi:MAG: glycosyltransferase family 4 protein [Bacteroidia bacterium]